MRDTKHCMKYHCSDTEPAPQTTGSREVKLITELEITVRLTTGSWEVKLITELEITVRLTTGAAGR